MAWANLLGRYAPDAGHAHGTPDELASKPAGRAFRERVVSFVRPASPRTLATRDASLRASPTVVDSRPEERSIAARLAWNRPSDHQYGRLLFAEYSDGGREKAAGLPPIATSAPILRLRRDSGRPAAKTSRPAACSSTRHAEYSGSCSRTTARRQPSPISRTAEHGRPAKLSSASADMST